MNFKYKTIFNIYFEKKILIYINIYKLIIQNKFDSQS